MTNQKLIASIPNGTISSIFVPNSGNSTGSAFFLLHVWGSPYQMGRAQAVLYQRAGVSVLSFIQSAWAYFRSQALSIDFLKQLPDWLAQLVAEVGLEAALEFTELATSEWTGTYFYQELQGIADGAGMTAYEARQLRWVHMLPGLTEGKCSMIGAWGAALAPSSPTKLLQLRALDWDMDGPFRDFPAIVIYHPDKGNGHAFMNIGVGSFIGGLTGVSSTQLGISEIGVAYPDSTFGDESRFGVPFVFLLRDILQFDETLQDALNRIIKTKRTCDLILGVGDGKSSSFRGVAYSATKVTVMSDEDMLPKAPWHPLIENVVYWGMDWICPANNEVLGNQLQKFHGQITAPLAIQQFAAVEGSGDNHLAYYDLTNLDVWVSFAAPHGANGPAPAYSRQFTHLNAAALFAVPRPQ